MRSRPTSHAHREGSRGSGQATAPSAPAERDPRRQARPRPQIRQEWVQCLHGQQSPIPLSAPHLQIPPDRRYAQIVHPEAVTPSNTIQTSPKPTSASAPGARTAPAFFAHVGPDPSRPVAPYPGRSGAALPAHGSTGPRPGRLGGSRRTAPYSPSSGPPNACSHRMKTTLGVVLDQTVTTNRRVVGGPGSGRHSVPESNCHIHFSAAREIRRFWSWSMRLAMHGLRICTPSTSCRSHLQAEVLQLWSPTGSSTAGAHAASERFQCGLHPAPGRLLPCSTRRQCSGRGASGVRPRWPAGLRSAHP